MSDDLEGVSKSDLIKALLVEKKRQRTTVVNISSLTSQLKVMYEKYTVPQEKFQPGDLIVWKQGLKNKKLPEEDTPVIVVEVLEDIIFDETKGSSGTSYFREPLDLKVGSIDDDGDFVIFHYDSKRFEKYSQE